MRPLSSNQTPNLVSWMLSVFELVAEPPARLVVATFLAGWTTDLYSRSVAPRATAGAWVLFAVFWLVQLPHVSLWSGNPIFCLNLLAVRVK